MVAPKDETRAHPAPRPTAPGLRLPGVATYQPEPYEPTAGQQLRPLESSVTPGQHGTVYPKRRTSRAVWVALLLIAALTVGFLVWKLRPDTGAKAAADIAYTSPTGHFSVTLPGQPAESQLDERVGPVRVRLHIAALPNDSIVVVEAEVRGRLEGSQRAFLSGMLQGLAGSSQLVSLGEHATRFHGHAGREGDYLTADGRAVTALVVGYGRTRYYTLIAPSGPDIDGLTASFVARR